MVCMHTYPSSAHMIHTWMPFTRQNIQLVQFLSRVRLFVIPWTAARQASLSITNSQRVLKFMSSELVMPSNHIILCHLLLLPLSIFPSIRVFSNESALWIMWPRYWSFSFSISPSSEYSGLISFRMDWLDLLAVQGTLKSLLQHRSSKASVLRHSDFFIVQLSHPYMTTGKTIALTGQTFVGKVMSLIFNMLAAAAASKSLQLCPTLCNPIDGSAPHSPIPGILQARTLEWAAISFSNAWKWKVKVKSLSRVWLLATPRTAAYQAPPSIGLSRQDYWSRVPLPSPDMLSRLVITFLQRSKSFNFTAAVTICSENDQTQQLNVWSPAKKNLYNYPVTWCL